MTNKEGWHSITTIWGLVCTRWYIQVIEQVDATSFGNVFGKIAFEKVAVMFETEVIETQSDPGVIFEGTLVE